ncbi:MAG: hypothetical protein IPK58_14390 [Acidobacteria bacterium]|nr:hypothetical protein [Acidobacteriota bacterium]
MFVPNSHSRRSTKLNTFSLPRPQRPVPCVSEVIQLYCSWSPLEQGNWLAALKPFEMLSPATSIA